MDIEHVDKLAEGKTVYFDKKFHPNPISEKIKYKI